MGLNGHCFLQHVKSVLGQEISDFLAVESSTNQDMADANMCAHSIKVPATAEMRSSYLDLIDSAKTRVVKCGAGKSFCWIYGGKSIADARATVIHELAS